jgi:Stage II sporulation protein E (SpoIIE)
MKRLILRRDRVAAYDALMFPRIRGHLLLFACLCASLTAATCHAWQTSAGAASIGNHSGDHVLGGIGRATLPLNSTWQFQTGDDPAWASPTFDDSGWQPIRVGRAWEGQGHPGYTGFGWYRLHLVLPDDARANWNLALLLPYVQDACEVYWNGVLVGSVGKLPPRPSWYLGQVPDPIPLGVPRSGVLAIRVWKAPHVYLSDPDEGGLIGMPQAGSLEGVKALIDHAVYDNLRGHLFELAEQLISGLVGLLALFAWLRNRQRRMLGWLALAMVFPVFRMIMFDVPHSSSFAVFYGLIGPAVILNDIASWFLLLYLLGLDDNAGLVRWTKILSVGGICFVLVDPVMVCFDWTRLFPRFFFIADVVSTIPVMLLELFIVVIVLFAIRKRLDAARWTLALSALISDLLQGAFDISGLGARWTHWTLAPKLSAPLVSIGGTALTASSLVGTLFLASIFYVAWRYSVEQSLKQSTMEQELRSAQELQQVLIPDALPTLPGYTVSSAYRPAQEVGGDFFQLMALTDGQAMLVIGDVSGKGLPAAMAVAMIVGAIRSTVETTDDPAAVLSALNRRVHGRLRGGFATCLALRLDAMGTCLIANAGHLPPFLNGQEVALPPALPLGVIPDLEVESLQLHMACGDRLTLYTDGLLEARNAAGELFGFKRIGDLLAHPRDAQEIAEAAQRFGQEDDITVLSLTAVRAAKPSRGSAIPVQPNFGN